MIKEQLYRVTQEAFKQHYPKFPWPKKHELEDQDERFQKTFHKIYQKVDEAIYNYGCEVRRRTENEMYKKLEIDLEYEKRPLKRAIWILSIVALIFLFI